MVHAIHLMRIHTTYIKSCSFGSEAPVWPTRPTQAMSASDWLIPPKTPPPPPTNIIAHDSFPTLRARDGTLSSRIAASLRPGRRLVSLSLLPSVRGRLPSISSLPLYLIFTPGDSRPPSHSVPNAEKLTIDYCIIHEQIRQQSTAAFLSSRHMLRTGRSVLACALPAAGRFPTHRTMSDRLAGRRE
jgi:hypothetical protein